MPDPRNPSTAGTDETKWFEDALLWDGSEVFVRGLRLALQFREAVADIGGLEHSGRVLQIRKALMTGEIASTVSDAEVMDALDEIFSITRADMPERSAATGRVEPEEWPELIETLHLLVEAVAFQNRLTSRAAAWEQIGISARRSRSIFSTEFRDVRWPLFFTLREYALGWPEG